MASRQGRRPYGTGGLYQDARGLWRATIEAGWTREGRRRRIYISSTTKRGAMQKLRDRQREIATTGLPTGAGRRTDTVKSWAERWLPIQATRLRPNAMTSTRVDTERWIIPTIGQRRLDQVSSGDVRAVATAILTAGRKASTAERAQSTLLSMLRSAVAEGLTVAPAALATRKVRRNRPERRAIPLSDALAILTAARTVPDASRWAAAFLEGLRPAEARGLQWHRIDLAHHRMEVSWQLQAIPYRRHRDRSSGFRVPADYEHTQLWHSYHLVRPKTHAGDRWIPLVPWMETALREWHDHAPRNEWDLVWPRAGGLPRSSPQDQRQWDAICDRAQVACWDADRHTGRRWDLYEARHTTATLLREAGVPDDVITAILGHETIASSEAYIDVSMDQARAALTAVAGRLGLTS